MSILEAPSLLPQPLLNDLQWQVIAQYRRRSTYGRADGDRLTNRVDRFPWPTELECMVIRDPAAQIACTAHWLLAYSAIHMAPRWKQSDNLYTVLWLSTARSYSPRGLEFQTSDSSWQHVRAGTLEWFDIRRSLPKVDAGYNAFAVQEWIGDRQIIEQRLREVMKCE